MNRKAKLRTYPVVERNSMVYAWRHPDDVEPQWESPRSPRSATRRGARCYRSSFVINTVPQEMAENGVDPAHFRYVHGTDDVAEMESYEHRRPALHDALEAELRDAARRHVRSHRRLQLRPGRLEGVLLRHRRRDQPRDHHARSTTSTTQVRFSFIVRKMDDEKLTSTVADAFVAEINKQIREDTPIWEHKVFLPVPALADTDGPILKFRKWYSQFYAEPVDARRVVRRVS